MLQPQNIIAMLGIFICFLLIVIIQQWLHTLELENKVTELNDMLDARDEQFDSVAIHLGQMDQYIDGIQRSADTLAGRKPGGD